MDNLSRLNETEESDKQGVFHILGEYNQIGSLHTLCGRFLIHSIGVFENVLGFRAELSVQLVSNTKILEWLLKRIQSKTHDENRGYAAEILSILLQNNRANRLELAKKDGVEVMLKVLSVRL